VTMEALMSKQKNVLETVIYLPRLVMNGVKSLLRGSVSLQRRTKISQKLFLEFESKLIEFQHFVIGLH
jgi:hypothetical protein